MIHDAQTLTTIGVTLLCWIATTVYFIYIIQRLQIMSAESQAVKAILITQSVTLAKVAADTQRLLSKVEGMTGGATAEEIEELRQIAQGNLDALTALDEQVPEDEEDEGEGEEEEGG